MLKDTESRKLGPPYNSKCTKKQSLDGINNLTYTYGACMGRCAALKMYEKCGDVIRALEDYIPEHRSAPDLRQTIKCFEKMEMKYFDISAFLSGCKGRESCKQKYTKQHRGK